MAESRTLAYLRQHRAHDVRALLARWRQVVKGTGFKVRTLGKKDGYPLVQVCNRIHSDTPGLYISTGIHGDEPAPLWGLLDWFERGGYQQLGESPVLLYPCLNPLGITRNHRVDGMGHDLNRIFDQEDLSPIREVRQAVRGRQFQLAICLHEDYDALGAYVYDLNRAGDAESAHRLLSRTVTKRIPLESRSRIDGRPADHGVIYRRRLDMRNIPGLPEAVFLFVEGHAKRTLTFETPSEFCLVDRINAHRRFLNAACRWMVSNA